MIETRYLKPIAPALILCLLAGCAVPQGNGAMPPGSAAANQDPCSVAGAATAGAVLGALIGAIAGGTKGALIGAAAGGAIGGVGCYASNVHSRQLKTAVQADSDYVQARGRLPAQPQVVAYDVYVSSNVIHGGKPFTVTTDAEVVNGRTQPVDKVDEQLVLIDPKGEPFKNGSKPLVATNPTGGQFENTFQLTLPPGISQGVYGVRTNLYVNNQLVASRDLRTQLVMEDGVGTLVTSR